MQLLRLALTSLTVASCHITSATTAAQSLPTDSVTQKVHVVTSRRGAWHLAQTENFQACSLQSADEAAATAIACEHLRGEVADLCGLTPPTWSPRCQIVLHANDVSYLAEVGASGAKTMASALTRRREGRIQIRKIDVRGNAPDHLNNALPHELCHILLADHFQEVPLWCDEGLALLLDPLKKQSAHARDLDAVAKHGALISLDQLLDLRQYPAADQWAAFYGQSASLVRCLLQRGTPQQLLAFAERQRSTGVNVAIREVYGLNGVADLHRHWHASLEMPIESIFTPIQLAESSSLKSVATEP